MRIYVLVNSHKSFVRKLKINNNSTRNNWYLQAAHIHVFYILLKPWTSFYQLLKC